MTEFSDRELNRVRTRFYDLNKSFFADRPDAEILGRWRGIVTALAGEAVSPAMDEAIVRLNRLLGEMSLAEIDDEFYTLFVNPYSEHPVDLTASRHLDGRPFGETLVAYREFLKQAGIGKFADVADSEDSLVLLLDAMITLIEQENTAMQTRLVEEFLAPMSSRFAAAMEENPAARFYSACADFLQAYMELEKNL